MLDPWIIDEIRRREEAEQEQRRPVLELPLEMPHYPQTDTRPEPPPEVERGVIIVEL